MYEGGWQLESGDLGGNRRIQTSQWIEARRGNSRDDLVDFELLGNFRSTVLEEGIGKGPPLRRALFSSLDQPRNHHVVVRADRYWILVGGTYEGNHIFSHVGQVDDLIDQSLFGTVSRP